jgi:hypothetical protein
VPRGAKLRLPGHRSTLRSFAHLLRYAQDDRFFDMGKRSRPAPVENVENEGSRKGEQKANTLFRLVFALTHDRLECQSRSCSSSPIRCATSAALTIQQCGASHESPARRNCGEEQPHPKGAILAKGPNPSTGYLERSYSLPLPAATPRKLARQRVRQIRVHPCMSQHASARIPGSPGAILP